MSSSTSYVIDYFLTRHIFLNDEWLSEVVKYIESKHRISGEPLAKAVFDQWLHAPLSESTHPSFQWPSGNVLEQNLVFQIDSILDIGSSYWSQYRAVTHVADNFDFFEAVNAEEVPKEKQFENNSSRMLLLELSDGLTKVKAIEYQKLPFLTPKTTPGSKILLYGQVKHRKQILWLTPANCQLLGGDIKELAFRNRQEAVLGRKLKIAKYSDEVVPDTFAEVVTIPPVQRNRRSDTENRSPVPVAAVAPLRQPEVITLSPCRPLNPIVPRRPNASNPPETVTLFDSQEVVAPRIARPAPVRRNVPIVEIVPDSMAVVARPNLVQQRLSFENHRQSPVASTSTADDVVADSDTEADAPSDAPTSSRERTDPALFSSNDNSSLLNLSISPIKDPSPKWVNPFIRQNRDSITTSTPKQPPSTHANPSTSTSRSKPPLKRLSFEDPDHSPATDDFDDNFLHDSDIETASPMVAKADTVTSSQERREQEALINSIREDSDPDDIFSEMSLQNLTVSPIKEDSKPIPFISRKRASGPAASTPKPPVVKRINQFFMPSTSQRSTVGSSLPVSHVKGEIMDEDDDDIMVLDSSPTTSKPVKTEVGVAETSPAAKRIKAELCDPDEISPEAVEQFKKQKLVTIAKALQRLKYSIGCMRMQIHAVMKRVLIPFHPEDNQWVMKILLYDETSTGLDCYVSHAVLVKLLGMTPKEAMAIKASRNKEKQRDGAKRIESIKTQLARLDIVFEIEFYSATNTIPLVVGVDTFSQLLLT
uniref:RecQ-mediated genome instability protein 1 n=1 Tax=Panagrellus redivivus TaxID=6233 RepID=A0A7E4WD56_PANRE